MRKDVLLRLLYTGASAELSQIWLSQYDDSGDLVAMIQLDHYLTGKDLALLRQAAALVAHVGQLQAF